MTRLLTHTFCNKHQLAHRKLHVVSCRPTDKIAKLECEGDCVAFVRALLLVPLSGFDSNAS